MKVERLDQLKTIVDAGEALSLEDSAHLLGEVWRLKTALAAKSMEADYLRMSNDENMRDLAATAGALRALQVEFEQHQALHGLAKCDLENRWSNCAVRMRKRARQS